MQPPRTTEGTVPKRRAATPDSNIPISLDEPMNMLLTADTRPFMFSGVSVCNKVKRMITLIQSNAPLATSSSNDNQKTVESAKPIIDSPKPATHHNKSLP